LEEPKSIAKLDGEPWPDLPHGSATGASLSAHYSEALPVRETQRKESSLAFRERKERLGSPVTKEVRIRGRSWFQSVGPMIAEARV